MGAAPPAQEGPFEQLKTSELRGPVSVPFAATFYGLCDFTVRQSSRAAQSSFVLFFPLSAILDAPHLHTSLPELLLPFCFALPLLTTRLPLPKKLHSRTHGTFSSLASRELAHLCLSQRTRSPAYIFFCFPHILLPHPRLCFVYFHASSRSRVNQRVLISSPLSSILQWTTGAPATCLGC